MQLAPYFLVNKLSNGTADPDWYLWRKAASGKEEDRVLVTNHAAKLIWDQPNKFYTQHEFIETFQQHIDLTGEGWWILDLTINSPVSIWIVRPDRMRPIPHSTEFLSGYIYTGPDGEEVPFTLDEVIQIKMPNPLDPYRGLGPVQALMVDLDTTRYSAEWNRNFFLNGAEPGGIIEVPTKLSDDEFNEMNERWREQHQGVNKAHRVAIIENGKWVNTKFTQKDMEFSVLREASRDIIREAFGIHKGVLGLVDDVNRANAEAGEYAYGKHLLVPRLERIKGTLNNKFLPKFGATAKGLEFDYISPVTGNLDEENQSRTSKVNAVKTLIDAGFDADEACDTVGLPRMTHDIANRIATIGGAVAGRT